ncbi:hypothetical protein ACFP1I_23280 [Dyadobacter subterraneus]|uniref:NERD domain-containing protein n=1 Tax=Dyadobacter subterraneus TaxID=2773304 RepID=A0ABR9WCE6_9BACT|nr:hypothetical protein [Dyadobacter subterraneus]MBE9461914.1 hypothetical protein [Dyadobacter subterraneus]
MPVHVVKEKYIVFKGEQSSENGHRIHLSDVLRAKFGNGPYDSTVVGDVVLFSLEYYMSEFIKICQDEKSVIFYQRVLELHENAIELTAYYQHQDISDEITLSYMAEYRRILKYILECGCDIQMVGGEMITDDFLIRSDQKIDELLFLGTMIITCVELVAEQSMIEDVADVSFDNNSLYVFSRKHHYELIIKEIMRTYEEDFAAGVNDETAFEDLKDALTSCFGIPYEVVGHLIAWIHDQLKDQGGYLIGVSWENFPANLNRMIGVSLEIAESFFKGLTLDKNNKMDLLSLACKPHNINRYMYKPILIWNVDDIDYAFLGPGAWTEAIIHYGTNAIPWGKAPAEWLANNCFKTYVHAKEDQHDKWLENPVEHITNELGLFYDRNVKTIRHKNGTFKIDSPGLGEVDFIIVEPILRKVYIVDCKHLLARYDMVNQKNDFCAFVKNKKSYNETLDKKMIWFNQNIPFLEQHFQLKYSDKNFSLADFEIEGIFIVNTPTFYMFNSKFRIYTLSKVQSLLSGVYTDFSFTIVSDQDEQIEVSNITYPFFQVPVQSASDAFSDQE